MHAEHLAVNSGLDGEHRVIAEDPATFLDLPTSDFRLYGKILEWRRVDAVPFAKVTVGLLRAIFEVGRRVLGKLVSRHCDEVVFILFGGWGL